jgi:hypothetical protein
MSCKYDDINVDCVAVVASGLNNGTELAWNEALLDEKPGGANGLSLANCHWRCLETLSWIALLFIGEQLSYRLGYSEQTAFFSFQHLCRRFFLIERNKCIICQSEKHICLHTRKVLDRIDSKDSKPLYQEVPIAEDQGLSPIRDQVANYWLIQVCVLIKSNYKSVVKLVLTFFCFL